VNTDSFSRPAPERVPGGLSASYPAEDGAGVRRGRPTRPDRSRSRLGGAGTPADSEDAGCPPLDASSREAADDGDEGDVEEPSPGVLPCDIPVPSPFDGAFALSPVDGFFDRSGVDAGTLVSSAMYGGPVQTGKGKPGLNGPGSAKEPGAATRTAASLYTRLQNPHGTPLMRTENCRVRPGKHYTVSMPHHFERSVRHHPMRGSALPMSGSGASPAPV